MIPPQAAPAKTHSVAKNFTQPEVSLFRSGASRTGTHGTSLALSSSSAGSDAVWTTRGAPGRFAKTGKEDEMSTISLTDVDVRVRDHVRRQLDWDPEVDASAIGVAAKNGS